MSVTNYGQQLRSMVDEKRAGKSEEEKTGEGGEEIIAVGSCRPNKIKPPTFGFSSSRRWSHFLYDARTPPGVGSASPVRCTHS